MEFPDELTLKIAQYRRPIHNHERVVAKTEPCQNSPNLLWLDRTVMLYIVQQWGINTGCSRDGWQTHINPFGGTRHYVLTNIDCMYWAGKYGWTKIVNDVVLSINNADDR